MTAWNESLVSHCKHVILNQHQACFYCIHEGLPTSSHTYSTYRGVGGKKTKVLARRHSLGRHDTSYGTSLSQCIMGYKLQSRLKSHSVLERTVSYSIQ